MHIIKLKLRQTSKQGFLATLTYESKKIEIEGFLPALPQALQTAFEQWQIVYRQLEDVRQSVTFNSELRLTPKTAIAGSNTEYINAVKTTLNSWLNSTNSEWQLIREGLIALANQFHQEGEQQIQFLLDVQEISLRRLPWQEWDLLEKYYPNSEIAFNIFKTQDLSISKNSYPKSQKIRILVIVGKSNGINTQSDIEIIQELVGKDSEVICLIQPNIKDLCQALWDDIGYHIFVFTGHSGSEKDGNIGWIELNEHESLSIDDFKNAFTEAIAKGLQLAIFNSCDGLGLANQLAELNLPQSIVMREPIPDEVAIEFIKHFFVEFIRDRSLFTSVQKAKKRLEPFKSRYPGANWLPTLCLRTSAIPITWQELKKQSSQNFFKNWQKIQFILVASILSFALGLGIQTIVPAIAPAIMSYRSTISSIKTFPPGIWQYGGSTTWTSIREQIDKKVRKEHPEFKLIYTLHPTLPPGSGTGIKMLLDGQISFVQSSRSLKDKEYESAFERGIILQQIPIAIDGIAITVHPNLNLPGLTIKQLKDIYTGKLTNWSQINGTDLEIIPYARSLQSGTTEFFRDNVLETEQFSDRVTFIEDKKIALKTISNLNNLGAIFITSAAEAMSHCEVKILPLSRYSNHKFVNLYKNEWKSSHGCFSSQNKINFDVFFNGDYPLSRRLFLIVNRNGQEDELVGETYSKFLLTDEGQKLIKKAGFIPLRLS